MGLQDDVRDLYLAFQMLVNLTKSLYKLFDVIIVYLNVAKKP